MGHYLACYDIDRPKGFSKVHRRVVVHTAFVQYSVYYLRGDQSDWESMLSDIRDVIEKDFRAVSVALLEEAIQKDGSWLHEDILLP